MSPSNRHGNWGSNLVSERLAASTRQANATTDNTCRRNPLHQSVFQRGLTATQTEANPREYGTCALILVPNGMTREEDSNRG